MRNQMKNMCFGIAGFLIGSLSIVGANQAIQAIQSNQLKVLLDGQVQSFKDETTGETQYPIIYNDRTYLPLRTVATLAGLDVDYDSSSNSALLKTRKSVNLIKSIKIDKARTIEKEAFEYDGSILTPLRNIDFEYNGIKYEFEFGTTTNEVLGDHEGAYLKYLPTNEFVFGEYENQSEFTINLYDFNKNDDEIDFTIDWYFNPADGPAEALYSVSKNNFTSLGEYPYPNFVTSEGKLGRYLYWIEEDVVESYYIRENGELKRVLADINPNIFYTVNTDIGIIKYGNDNSNYENTLKAGGKVKILELIETDDGWVDYKIQRENGDVLVVGQLAGRT